ncbi:MAG: prephenate dehydratase [Candidatus Bathyarchaeia archaeon]
MQSHGGNPSNYPMRIAYLGPRGTFCEEAARKYASRLVAVLIPMPDIADVFQSVSDGGADLGVVPLENSIEGSVGLTLDLLLESDLWICGEIDLRISHNLIAKPGTRMEDIRVLASHPQALAQCRKFIASRLPKVEMIEASSTSRAVELIKGIEGAAAIGTELAAELNGMEILERGIEDSKNNFTRFLAISKADFPPTGSDKTSIIFSVENKPGALYRALEEFAKRDINLTKIESRPTKRRPWEYVFYVDFEGHREDEKCKEALECLRLKASFLKVLGSYPMAK